MSRGKVLVLSVPICTFAGKGAGKVLIARGEPATNWNNYSRSEWLA